MLQRIVLQVLLIFIYWLVAIKSVNAQNLDPELVRALIAETKALRAEVSQLKKELAAHKSEHKSPLTKARPHFLPAKKNKTKQAKAKQTKVSAKKSPLIAPKPTEKVQTLGGFTPIIAPYLGHEPAYNGTDLITNLSQQSADLLVLQYREELENAFSNQKLSDFYLVLSGTLGTQSWFTSPYFGRGTSDIDLTVANITALTGIGKWVSGFLSFDYDNRSLNSLTPPQIGQRVGNSRVYLDQGFITLGNLKKFSGYAALGQMYLPFGQYNSYSINSPLTASLFTTSERPILVGYSHKSGSSELNAAIYGYHGDTVTSTHSSAINEWGANIDYLISKANWSGELQLGYIANIADAAGFQLNGQLSSGCTVFGGLAFPCNRSNVLRHRVPGFDVNVSLTIGPFNLISEYITATRSFAPLDLAFNRNGARPQAFDLEGAYAFNFFSKPSSIALGYAFTKEALALLLPARQYSLTFTTSFWRNTTESIGYQHDVNYRRFTTASGQALPIYFPADRVNLGQSSDTLTLAVNAYF